MLTFERSVHRFFDDLVTFLVTNASLGVALVAQHSGVPTACTPGHSIALVGSPRVTNVMLRFFPYQALQAIVRNGWPETVQIEEEPIAGPRMSNPHWLTGQQGLLGLMIQSTFVHYFETVRRQEVITRFGTEPQYWPPVWNFGRVIRNAFAHGGQIDFQNLYAPAVNWRTLSYSPANNGQTILFADVTPVEIIYLMSDMDAAL
jgi:hypothetical protein